MNNGDQLDIAVRLLVALALGAAIGFERELRGHEAGVRTTSLVCLGAAIFGVVSLGYGDSRVAAGVVQGIGFLGAGLIFQRRGQVGGVTTAVTMWVVAGIGLIVAQHLWLLALVSTAAVIVMLELAPVSEWATRLGRDVPPNTRARARAQAKRDAERDDSA